MEFAINTDHRDKRHPLVLRLTHEEARRLRCEADYTGSIRVCPMLRELLDAWEEFDAETFPKPSTQHQAPTTDHQPPLVRTGPGGCYTRDIPAEQLAGDRVEAVGELGSKLNITA